MQDKDREIIVKNAIAIAINLLAVNSKASFKKVLVSK
jgi:hypothetical protein